MSRVVVGLKEQLKVIDELTKLKLWTNVNLKRFNMWESKVPITITTKEVAINLTKQARFRASPTLVMVELIDVTVVFNYAEYNWPQHLDLQAYITLAY